MPMVCVVGAEMCGNVVFLPRGALGFVHVLRTDEPQNTLHCSLATGGVGIFWDHVSHSQFSFIRCIFADTVSACFPTATRGVVFSQGFFMDGALSSSGCRERCISTVHYCISDPTCDVKEILHELNKLHTTWEIGAKEGRSARQVIKEEHRCRIQDVSSSSFFSRWHRGGSAAPIPVLINPLYDARYISAFELSRA